MRKTLFTLFYAAKRFGILAVCPTHKSNQIVHDEREFLRLFYAGRYQERGLSQVAAHWNGREHEPRPRDEAEVPIGRPGRQKQRRQAPRFHVRRTELHWLVRQKVNLSC